MINVILVVIISVVFVFAFTKTISSWRDGKCPGCSGEGPDSCAVCRKKEQEKK